MVQENIFTHWLFVKYLLPFILVFVLVFAILDKTNVLGEGKKQINAIIGLVAGLVVLGFSAYTDFIVKIIPFMVVVAIIAFVFILLYSFISGNEKGDPFNKGFKITFGIVIFIALTIAILVITGRWDNVFSYMSNSNMGANLLFIILAIVAVVIVLTTDKKKSSGDE